MYDPNPGKSAMDKALDHLKKQLQGLHVGRASTATVDSISAMTSYGPMQLNQIANITTPDNQTIKIEPWDKANVKAIETAIYDANNGLTPQNQGSYVMITIPPLTQERRQEIVKQVRAMGEDTKAVIRQVRQDEMKKVKKLFEDKEISEDERKNFDIDIDDMTKNHTTMIDQYVKAKSDDVVKV